MVDNQRKKEQDVRNLIAALKKVHKKNEETDLEVKKVMNKVNFWLYTTENNQTF